MKGSFPGDPEFAVEKYYKLPYKYVLDAYEFCIKNRQKTLHEQEAPIALLSSLIANTNRDPKKNKKPFKMNDFFLYEPIENQNIPMHVYGSAAMKLLEMGQFPNWALFVYKDLKQSAAGEPPDLLAYLHKSAILLAPILKDDAVKGMLICEDKIYNQIISMESPCGKKIQVFIPSFDGRYAATEDIELNLIK